MNLQVYKIWLSNVTVIITALLMITACSEDIIDIDFAAFEKSIVIEGTVSDRPGDCIVKLSRIENYFEDGFSTTISGADVFLSDEKGNSEKLNEVSAGTYSLPDFAGSPGVTYKLDVSADGESYFATAAIPEPVELDSIETEYLSYNNYNLVLYIKNKNDIDEYARIKIYKNGYLLEEKLYLDQHVDDETVMIKEEGFRRLDRAEIEIISISKSTYKYLLDLQELEDMGDTDATEIVQLAAGNPNSNISNDALGYFSAQSYKEYFKLIR